jgi:hypothetical protein
MLVTSPIRRQVLFVDRLGPSIRLARMTSERSSKMGSTPAKLDLTKGRNPWATAGHHTPSARISVAC